MNAKVKSITDTEAFVKAVASKQGWIPSADDEFRGIIIRGLTTNYNRYGFFLCPCRDGAGIREADKDITCPCAYANADIAQYGHCFCGLFQSPEFARSGLTSEGIPERRPDELWI